MEASASMITSNADPKSSSSPRKPSKPTNSSSLETQKPKTEKASFLSLPHELRQNILHQTHGTKSTFKNTGIMAKSAMCYHLRIPFIHANDSGFSDRKNDMAVWKRKLKSVHPDLDEDVEHVGEKWMEELKGILEKGDCGLKEITYGKKE